MSARVCEWAWDDRLSGPFADVWRRTCGTLVDGPLARHTEFPKFCPNCGRKVTVTNESPYRPSKEAP